MARNLTKIFGTEQDKVNCPFFYKMGACRHGDRCSRLHHRPAFSVTVLLAHMYQNPRAAVVAAPGQFLQHDPRKIQEDFEDFFEEVFEELAKSGEVEELNICDNLGDHMVGNVYVKFADEEAAQRCLQTMHGRFFAGRMLTAEYSPVTDFREARCRQFDEGNCKRGDHCNFMHLKNVPRALWRELRDGQPHKSTHKRRDDERKDDHRDRHRDSHSDRRGYDDRRGGYDRGYDDRRGGYDRDGRRGGYDDDHYRRHGSPDHRSSRRSSSDRHHRSSRDDRDRRHRSRSPARRHRSGSRDRGRDDRRHRDSRDAPRDGPREAPRDDYRRDAPRDAPHDAPREAPRDDYRREAPRDAPREAPRDAPRDGGYNAGPPPARY